MSGKGEDNYHFSPTSSNGVGIKWVSSASECVNVCSTKGPSAAAQYQLCGLERLCAVSVTHYTTRSTCSDALYYSAEVHLQAHPIAVGIRDEEARSSTRNYN